MRVLFGVKPFYIEIKERRRVQKRLMSRAGREYPFSAVCHGEPKHRLDGESRALGRIESFCRTENARGIRLALGDYSVRGKEVVRTEYFGEIERLCTERPAALMTRHVKAHGTRLRVFPCEIVYRCFHNYSSSSASATFIITAHSIRFLKSSQPYSYIPPIEPVAW